MFKKLWLKFEFIVNKIIALIIDILAKIYLKTVPQKYQQQISGSIQNLNIKYLKFTKHFEKKIKPKKTIPKFSFKNLLEPLKKFRLTVSKFVLFTKNIDFKVLDFRKIILDKIKYFRQLTQPLVNRTTHFLSTLTPNTILIIIFSFAFLVFVSLVILKSGRTIYVGVMNNQGNQMINENEVTPKYRESFFKRILPAKQLEIYEVTMPIYVDSSNSVRTLLIDITLVASNRYTRQFLDGNTGLVKDRLNNTIHPIIPDFPLTKEGKTIVKEKIIFEINTLLKEQKIEGEVEEVYFQMIIVA